MACDEWLAMSDARFVPMTPIHIGLLGIGTVGGGTFSVLARNHAEIVRRAGRDLVISAVADKDLAGRSKVTTGAARLTDDAWSLVRDPELDIIVELIGGYTIARELVLAAIENGKHVVTRTSAARDARQRDLRGARKKNVVVAFEAAVAGGIRSSRALREGLTANRIQWIAGFINGTSKFILSENAAKGLDFASVLKEAQARGYAEADPTFDIEGVDAAHKLTIMSAIGFGVPSNSKRPTPKGSPTHARRYPLRGGARVSDQAPRHYPAREEGDRAPRASDADSGEAAHRERRRRDERGARQGRCRRRDALLRAPARCGADGERDHRRFSRCDAHAHG
jgi:hypothetical protein